jgi:hypothetical protein
MHAACARSRTFKSWSPADPAVTRSPFCRAINLTKSVRSPALALAAVFIAASGSAIAATTPQPGPAPHPSPIVIHLPNVPLHSEVVVEVNKKGQVVRVKSTKPSKARTFNVQTYGNALQMWIRKPNGTAQVGLYRITYDYNPKTQDVTRRVALISAGGNWGDAEGAANVMMDMARKQAEAAHKAQQEQTNKLPSLNQIRGAPTPRPTPAATLPP